MRSAQSLAGVGTTRADAWWPQPSAHRVAESRRSAGLSYDALKVLQRVWAASGGQCGKYLKESMPLLLDLLEASGELDDEPRYTPAVRDELVAMSAATTDRYLAPVRATEQLRGKSTTKAGPLAFAAPSRSARPAGEIEAEPGFFEVRHRRPLRADPQRRVHPDCEHDRRAHGVDLHSLNPKQR